MDTSPQPTPSKPLPEWASDVLSHAILEVLHETPGLEGVSLPRMGKSLGHDVSVLLRRLHLLSSATIGGQPGLAWVRVEQMNEHWIAHLTDAGRVQWAQWLTHGFGSMNMQQPTDFEASEGAPLLSPVVRAPVKVFANAASGVNGDDAIATEVPVALVFNGISHAVMMATPQDLSSFALGFALSEGLIDSTADCRGIDVLTARDGASCEVQLEVSAACFARLKEKRRALAGRTGCGVCGIDSLEALDLVPERVARQTWLDRLDVATVLKAINSMPPLQHLNAEAGSLHAAGWASPTGEVLVLMEDVGRHNALDKLIGHLAERGRLAEPGFVVMSSRASFELVRKCARLGLGALATVSAPTSLAIQIAQQAQMRLWGLCRGQRAVQYAG